MSRCCHFSGYTFFNVHLCCQNSGDPESRSILSASREHSFKSSAKAQYVLVSNNQRPDNALFILIAGNGYVAKISCEHYAALCTDDYNQSHTRQIQNVNLVKVRNYFYIENIQFQDSRTGQITKLSYSINELKQFYNNDISNLKYILFAISLFALAALFVSIKILKNFSRFLEK